MRVLIRRGQFVNKGAEAMVRTVQSELGARLDDVSFTVPPEAVFPKTEPLVSAAGLDVLTNGDSRREKIRRLAGRVLAQPLQARRAVTDRRWMDYLGLVEQVDAIVDVAGHGYGDVWGTGKALITQHYLSAARERGIPYMFMPQAWGPFEKLNERPVNRRLCEEASLLYTRDEASRRYVAELLGRNVSDVPIAPDIAFRFRGASRGEGRELLRALGLPASAGLIAGVAPNQKVYERATGTGFQNEYVRRLCEICVDLRQHGATVVLVPHEIQPSNLGTTDDRLLCSMVASHLRDEHVLAMTERYTAEQIKGVIANFDVLIGSRFHALIAALSQGIPVAALGWSHKYAELLSTFSLDEFIVGHEQLGRSAFSSSISHLLNDRTSHRERIEERLEPIRTQVDLVFDRVAQMVRGSARRAAART